jgi:Holliday junction resolvase RusA-like endonuclease
MISFVVLGHPQAKGSKRAIPIRGRSYPALADSNPRAKAWASLVSGAAHEAMAGAPILRVEPVAVELAFYFDRPKGHYGTGRNAWRLKDSAPSHMIVMPDADKLARCALDALTGIVFRDDAQVADLGVVKWYGTPERAEVRISVLGAVSEPLPLTETEGGLAGQTTIFDALGSA